MKENKFNVLIKVEFLIKIKKKLIFLRVISFLKYNKTL